MIGVSIPGWVLGGCFCCFSPFLKAACESLIAATNVVRDPSAKHTFFQHPAVATSPYLSVLRPAASAGVNAEVPQLLRLLASGVRGTSPWLPAPPGRPRAPNPPNRFELRCQMRRGPAVPWFLKPCSRCSGRVGFVQDSCLSPPLSSFLFVASI